MAFPDYGPLPEISQFTQNGFSQGAFLFKLFAGEIENSLALHYVGLTFALVGAIAIVFMKQFHNIKTIGSWTFILIVLLIGPKGALDTSGPPGKRADSTFFVSIPVNNSNNPEGLLYADAFTPQALVVDIMSKIHKAIYLGFFDISDTSAPRARNLIEDLSSEESRGINMGLRERPDIKQEISIYTHFCGKSTDLALPLYDDVHQTNTNIINNYLRDSNLPSQARIPSYQHSLETTFKLQQKIFMAAALPSMFSIYEDVYKKLPGTTYPPFAIAYKDIADLDGTLTKSGMSGKVKNIYLTNFDANDGEEIAESEEDYSDFLVTKKRLIDAINGGAPFNKISGSLAYDTPAFAALVTSETALPDVYKMTDPYTGQVVYDTDAIEKRLTGYPKAAVIAQEHGVILPFGWGDDKWVSQVVKGNMGSTPVSLGFLTPSLKSVYADRSSEAPNRLDELSGHPILNVVSNCAQLHQMTHAHIRDALVFQNMWPTGPNPQFSISREYGFSPMVFGGINDYLKYPYPPSDNLSLQQKSINKIVQTQALAFSYTDPTDNNKFKNLLNDNGDPISRDHAAEALRRAVVAKIITTGIQNSGIYASRFSNEGAQQAAQINSLNQGSDDVSIAMRNQASGASIAANMPNLVSGPLQEFTSWVADIGMKVKAQFEGIGAVAFIRFLQLFIAIGLFFIIMCTPILYMMGLLVPAHAPGVIITSLLSIVALKAIPIGFTLVDAVMTNAMSSYDILNFNDTDMALMLYVTATAYTSITMITFFLLFKAGDTQSVIGQMTSLDNKANEIADTAGTIVKGLAVAAGAAVTAGAGGAIGAAAKGSSLKNIAGAAATQGGEVFGKRGAAAIPGAGNVMQEITNSYREGGGQAKVMAEVDSNNKDIDAKVASIDSDLKSGSHSPEEREAMLKERDSLLSQRKSYNQHMTGYADAQAEEKYRSKVRGAQDNWAAGRAEEGFGKAAASQGMSTEEARRKERDAKAEAAVNSTLSSAVTAQKVEMQGDVQIGDATISPQAAQAIAQGLGKANLISTQGSPERIAALEKSAINKEMDAGTNDILNNQVDGPGRKPIFKPFDRVMTDENGNIRYDKDGQPMKETVTQDPLYDQGASALKSKMRKDPELKNVDSATYTKTTERIAAEELAKHANGTLKMNLDSRASDILGYENLAQRASSGKAKDLWVTPDQEGYEELRQITGTGEGEAVSLFSMHMERSADVQTRARDLAKSHQARLDDAAASVGLKKAEPKKKDTSTVEQSLNKRNS